MCAVPASASAATTTITVPAGGTDTAPNAGACNSSANTCPNLRDAIDYANKDMAGTDPTIQLAAGEYDLTDGTGALSPTVQMTIAGAGDTGSGASTIKQTVMDRVINAGAVLTLQDLIVTGGHLVGTAGTMAVPGGGDAEGGGIFTTSTLTLTDAAVTHNTAASGAGFSSSSAGGDAGIVFGSAIDAAGSMLTISGSIVSDNTGTGGAGGDATSSGAGGGGGRVAGTIYSPVTMISNTTITGNVETGGQGGSGATGTGAAGGQISGAAIQASGDLTISGSTVNDNTATAGSGGTASAASQPAGSGGAAFAAIFIYPAGSLMVSTTTVSGNQTNAGNGGNASGIGGTGGDAGGGEAGAVAVDETTPVVAIASSEISDNTLTSGTPGNDTATSGVGGEAGETDGGGIDVESPSSGSVTIAQSTIAGNHAITAAPGTGGSGGSGGPGAFAFGGGLYIDGPSAKIVDSTVSGNSAQSQNAATGGGEASLGGGLSYTGSTLELYSDTIAGNEASASLPADALGANLNLYFEGEILLEDTAIATPLPAGTANCSSSGGSFIDNGHNLEDTSPSTCGLSGADHDQIGSSADLPSTVGANGGTTGPTDPTTGYVGTYTLAPALGSQLIGNGGACVNPVIAGDPPLSEDQRGFARPAACDIGAFQTEPLTVTGTPAITGKAAVGQTLTCATGTFATAGDGAFTSTGAVGAPALTYAWTSNGTSVGATSTYKVTTRDQQHSITCTVTATGAYGHGLATSTAVQISKLPPISVAVKLTAVGQSHRSWAERKRKRKHKVAIGTSFKFTLNEAATVKLTFTTTLKGRKVSHKCVAQTSKNKHKPKCTTARAVGTMTVSGRAGKNTVAFAGKIGGHELAPGTDNVTITATSGKSTSSKTLSFTIVK
jgi:hypothetical protein